MGLSTLATVGLLLGAATFIPQAHADPVLWTISGAAYFSGGTVSGSFDYNADTNTYSNMDITTTSGSGFAGATYTASTQNANPSSTSLQGVTGASPPYTGQPSLHVIFDGPLTDSGGSESITSFVEGPCNDADCHLFAYIARVNLGPGPGALVTASLTLTAVPEPASITLFTAATIGFSWLRRRRA